MKKILILLTWFVFLISINGNVNSETLWSANINDPLGDAPSGYDIIHASASHDGSIFSVEIEFADNYATSPYSGYGVWIKGNNNIQYVLGFCTSSACWGPRLAVSYDGGTTWQLISGSFGGDISGNIITLWVNMSDIGALPWTIDFISGIVFSPTAYEIKDITGSLIVPAPQPPTTWAKTYGGASTDDALSIQQTSDGGYIITGTTNSFGADHEDFWVLKLNSNGTIQWQKTYGGTEYDYAHSIRQTTDGGYIVAGDTYSFGATGYYDIWILKLNSNGTIQWQKTYGGTNIDSARTIQQTSDGGYIVAGSTYSFDAGYDDIWILKLDSNGTIQWQKTYGGAYGDFTRSIQQTSDGGYIVVGETTSFGIGYSDVWILKLNSNGIIQWQKTYGGTGDDGASSIHQTSDGGYIITGVTNSFGIGYGDIWVLKLDSNGTIQWQKTYGGTNIDSARTIQQTSDGGYIVAGETSSFGTGGYDIWILKLNSDGTVAWQKTYGGTSYDNAFSIQQTSDGGYIVAGWTSSFGAGGSDIWILKLDSNGNINDPTCTIIGTSNAIVQDTNVTPVDTSAIVSDTNAIVTETAITPVDTNANVDTQCWGVPPVPTSEQPLLKAPWEGIARISQGNHGSSHKDYGTWDNTYAIDVALPVGSDVLAPADGTVIWYDDDPGGAGGKELAIQHIGPTGKKFVTVYLHLSDIIVKSGAVKQGQVVAKSGDTGEVTGPHLHFHMWSGSGSYDSHTIPIERLVMKQVGVDDDFREYNARKGDLDDSKIAGKDFESNNILQNQPPVANAGEDQAVFSGDLVIFDGSNSYDPDGTIVSYRWDFGDGMTAEGKIVSHRFRGAQSTLRTYNITLRVEDDKGATATDTLQIVVKQLTKSVEVSSAGMTMSYNWVGEVNGEDIYIVSKISALSLGMMGMTQFSITNGEDAIWRDVWILPGIHTENYISPFTPSNKWWELEFGSLFGVSPPIAKLTFPEDAPEPIEVFEGIKVRASDRMEVMTRGLDPGIPSRYDPPVPSPNVDTASTAFDPDAPTEVTTLFTPLEKVWNWITGKLFSPGELRVYDSQGRITGLVNGKVIEEIPYSAYRENMFIILLPSELFTYEVVGTDEGTYGLGVASVKDRETVTFTASDIPTSPNTTHQYSIDWDALSQGEEGVTMDIDNDGDGVFEKTITSDSELTQEEFIEATIIKGDLDGDGDVDRDDLNKLLSFRNQPASQCPECDIDEDGIITVLDARRLVLLCTRPRCAIQ